MCQVMYQAVLLHHVHVTEKFGFVLETGANHHSTPYLTTKIWVVKKIIK